MQDVSYLRTPSPCDRRARRTTTQGSEELSMPPLEAHAGGSSQRDISAVQHAVDDETCTHVFKHNTNASEWLRKTFPQYDHYNPNQRGLRLILSAYVAIFSIIAVLTFVLDRHLYYSSYPGFLGFRFILSGMTLYFVVYRGLKLWVEVEWIIYSTTKRGINFQPRVGARATRSVQIEKLRQKVQSCLQRKDLANGQTSTRRKIIAVVGFGGGGHEATLKGVRDVISEAGLKIEIIEIPVGFLCETDAENPFWKLTGCTGEQLYNWGLQQSGPFFFLIMWLLTKTQRIAVAFDKYTSRLARCFGIHEYGLTGKISERVWREYQPDMVCNFTTGTTDFLMQGLDRAGMSHIPFVSVVSDFEGLGAHSWIEDQRQYVIGGTSICRQQALDFGLASNHVFQTSGMILRPCFYDPDEDDSLSLKDKLRKLGLDSERRTCVIFWGGVASKKVKEISIAVANGAKETLNLIILCGRNAALAEELKAIDWPCSVCIQGFTQRVCFYMQLADMIVCKPGPGVCSEAALLGVPIIVEWSCWTLAQEVEVSRWVMKRGLGLGFARTSQLVAQVNRMCELLKGEERLNSMSSVHVQQRPVAISEKGLSGFDLSPANNAAVFEVPAILQDIMDNHTGAKDTYSTESPKTLS